MLKKHLLILIATLGMISTSGCSLFSSDSSEETEEAVAEDTATSDEVSESTEDSDSSFASNDEEEVVDEYPDDDYGGEESSVATTSEDSDSSAGDSTTLPDVPLDTTEEGTLFVGADDTATTDDADEDTSATDTAYAGRTEKSSSVIQDTYVAPTTMTPVKKMKKTPYNAGGSLINRLYIARDGDSMKSIAQKIYGDSGRSSDLLTWNSHFRGKSVKVGDKIYYSSATNPNDNSQILLYYEEAGITPSYYTAQSGDSIRKVAKSLLGHPSSWMEIWATNEVESKWELQEGTQLRYWPSDSSAAPVQAATQPVSQPVVEEMPEEEVSGAASSVAASGMSEPPEMAETPAMDEMPPMEEPTMDNSSAAMVAENEPPPPEASAPPPPPAPIDPPAPPSESSSAGLAGMMNGEDDSMLMAVLGGLMFVAALILLVFIRRGRKKVNYG